MVMTKRVFFNGCSFTADSGFMESNRLKYHWPEIFSKHYNCYFYNAAIGGSSNEEIFYRTIENCYSTDYDLIITMWSAVGRKWVYWSDNNIDDFTIINSCNTKGFDANRPELSAYAKLHYAYFNNQYINLKQWLEQIIALKHFFSYKQQKYVFVKGFDNLIFDIDQIKFNDDSGFSGMSHRLKGIFDFDNRPDYYIKEKLDILKSLILEIKSYNWAIDFTGPGFGDSKIDFSDDLSHPGIISNQSFASHLIDYCDKKNLL
jgi:hypothetical protein